MVLMPEEIPSITSADTAELLDRLRPGVTYAATTLWTEYVRLMDEKGRMIATRNALGRALTAAGARRKRVRKRAAGKPVEVHSWVIPGAEDTESDRDHVRAVMDDLGQGFHPNSLIFQRYAELGRRNGWRVLLGETAFARLLTQMGYPRKIEKGEPCRYVGRARHS